jgi:hypothetical protein
MVEIPLNAAITEHKELTKALNGNLPPEKMQEVKKEQQEELRQMQEVARNYRHSPDINLSLDQKTGNTTVIFGASKMGKSTLAMYLYRKYFAKSIAVLFTESPQIGLYKGNGKLIISQSFHPSIIREAHRINKRTKNKYDFTFIMDDIIDQKDNTTLKKMIMVLRNSNISTIISLQDPKLFAKSNRNNVNNIIFFRYGTDEATEGVIRSFLMSKLPGTMEQKIKFYQQMTADHGFIYLNPREDTISFHRLHI